MNRREHLMVIAMEECNEVAQRISKALRFGMEQVQQAAGDKPEQNPLLLTNKERIVQEYYDLRAVLGMMGIDAWENSPVSKTLEYDKIAKVNRYLLLSAERGTLS